MTTYKAIHIKKRDILYSVLLFPVVIDIITGIFLSVGIDFSIGKLFRGVIYFTGLIYVLLNTRKETFVVYFAIIWGVLFICWWSFSKNFSFFREISFFFKSTYFFMVLALVRQIRISGPEKVGYVYTILKRYAQAVSTMIVFSFFTGIGLQTYGDWVFGTTSFFVAQNDIGITQLLIFAFLLFNKERVKISWFWLVMVFFSLVLLGTTTGMFGSSLVVFIYVFFKLIIAKITSVKNLYKRMLIIAVLAVSIIGALSYLVSYIQGSDYYSRKYQNFLKERNRSRLTASADAYFESRGALKNVFGEGFSAFTKNYGDFAPDIKYSKRDVKDWLLVETDMYDFKGAYGILLSVLFFSYFLYVLLLSFLKYYRRKDIYNLSLLFIMLLAIGHGFLAGHVFYSPTTLGVLAIFVFLILSQATERCYNVNMI